MAGRLAIDPGGDLPALLQIEPGRLEMNCGQHRAGTAAAPRFFLRHSEEAAAETATPQFSGRKNLSTLKSPSEVRPNRPPTTFCVSGSRTRIASARESETPACA